MRVGSLFSGIGGFDLGLERAGHEIVWQVEIDKQCRSVLRRHWHGVPIYEDVCDVGGSKRDGAGVVATMDRSPESGRREQAEQAIDGSVPSNGGEYARTRTTLAPVDLICGGFPCQDVSVAGKRAGLAGERSGLWWEFHRIIGELTPRPRWVLIENVPGLLSSNEGRDMAVVVHGLEELGYGWTYRVLDSQYFGVAQRRRRVFIVGHLGGPCPPEILLEPESLFGDSAPSREARAGVTPGAAFSLKASGGNQQDDHETYVGGFYGNAGSRDLCYRSDGTPALKVDGPVAVAQVFKPSHYTRGKDGAPSEISPPLSADADKGDQDSIAFNIYPKGGQGSVLQASETTLATALDATALTKSTERGTRVLQSVFRKAQKAHDPDDCERWEHAEHANTLNGQGDTAGVVPVQQSIPRRLTPVECERLQGFPDDWTAWGVDEDGERIDLADGPRYRMMGNAVTVNVAEWIGRRLPSEEG